MTNTSWEDANLIPSMKIPETLQTMFSANIEQQNDSYVIEVPKNEIRIGQIDSGELYRVAVLSSLSNGHTENANKRSNGSRTERGAPVSEGEHRVVEIEDLGEQGDGISRVERGFVVIVPHTNPGDRVKVEITDVQDSVAFAEVVEQ